MAILPVSELDLRPTSKIYSADISVLRDKLQQLRAWPEAGDMYVQLLGHSHQDPQSYTDKEREWLSAAARDAVKGQDIGAKYPAFFQKLLTNDSLRRDFLFELLRHSKRQ